MCIYLQFGPVHYAPRECSHDEVVRHREDWNGEGEASREVPGGQPGAPGMPPGPAIGITPGPGPSTMGPGRSSIEAGGA